MHITKHTSVYIDWNEPQSTSAYICGKWKTVFYRYQTKSIATVRHHHGMAIARIVILFMNIVGGFINWLYCWRVNSFYILIEFEKKLTSLEIMLRMLIGFKYASKHIPCIIGNFTTKFRKKNLISNGWN